MFPGRRRHGNGLLLVALLLAFGGARACGNRPASTSSLRAPARNPIENALREAAPAASREGIAAAILIDTSGSMKESVPGADGQPHRKIEIAQQAALNLVRQFDAFARENPDKVIYLGIYEFSERRREPSVRTVIKLGPPDPSASGAAIAGMKADGDTPIGDAMIAAKRDLDASGLSKRHMLVLTDGENNRGYSPVNVMQVLAGQSDQSRASVYFVAFDVAAAKFNAVRDSGAVLLGASNETDLKGTLDYLLSGKILAEQPPR